jgi:hypothetical protein
MRYQSHRLIITEERPRLRTTDRHQEVLVRALHEAIDSAQPARLWCDDR